ncbi:MAG: hypothetical protein A3F41_05425 [Coxiella sp. RIFCSPHIGHO2_12_FULL_44_14]|nr:MAG: hypothetical protein A3F41_05425 [Coxiella sp. RIFCSPHIGHO2_12_FULL_44_14]
MPAYSSDKEQVEELKALWKEYGRWILLAVAVGFGVSYGWRYWQVREVKQNLVASDQYQNILAAIPTNNWEQIAAKKQVLQDKYPKLAYTAFANFLEAKHYVELNQYQKALADLKMVIVNTEEPSLKQIARIRSASILLAEKDAAAAKKILSVVDSQTYAPMIQVVQGDIALAEKNPKQAGVYYKEAFEGLMALDIQQPIFALKALMYH